MFDVPRLNTKIVSVICHQPLFAYNEDCFGELIFACFRAAGAETFVEIISFPPSCLPRGNPEALMIYAVDKF